MDPAVYSRDLIQSYDNARFYAKVSYSISFCMVTLLFHQFALRRNSFSYPCHTQLIFHQPSASLVSIILWTSSFRSVLYSGYSGWRRSCMKNDGVMQYAFQWSGSSSINPRISWIPWAAAASVCGPQKLPVFCSSRRRNSIASRECGSTSFCDRY